MPDIIIMGKLGSPFGVKGWIKVISSTKPPENILSYQSWLLKKQNTWQTVKIEESKRQAGSLVVKLESINDRDQAALLTNSLIGIKHEHLPSLNDNEYYWADLVGLEVLNKEGHALGRITSLFATGSNDVIVVSTPEKKELLIPYLKHVIQSIDLKSKKVIVDWDANF